MSTGNRKRQKRDGKGERKEGKIGEEEGEGQMKWGQWSRRQRKQSWTERKRRGGLNASPEAPKRTILAGTLILSLED